MNRIFVTGHKGRIGRRLVSLGAMPLDIDITNEVQVNQAIKLTKPDLIIHAAAKSSIDYCQQHEARAWEANVTGAHLVFKHATMYDAKVLFLSSEQVFSGKWLGNYKEDAKGKPVNTYGHTKWLAEALANVWDFKTLRLSRGVSIENKDVEGVFACLQSDKFTAPSFFYRNYQHIDFLAEQIWWCANHYYQLPNILHLGGIKQMSWYDFVGQIAQKAGYTGKIVKRKKDFKQFTPRPHRCGLNTKKAWELGVPMRPIEDTIRKLLDEQNSNSSL